MGRKFQLPQMSSSRDLLHNTVPKVSNTVLCTSKFVESNSHVVFLLLKKRNKETKIKTYIQRTQENFGRSWMHLLP